MNVSEAEFDKVVFLYHLKRGQAGASYGLNVASLAGLPSNILQLAHRKSKQLEADVLRKTQRNPEDYDSAAELHSLLAVLKKPHVSVAQALCNHHFV